MIKREDGFSLIYVFVFIILLGIFAVAAVHFINTSMNFFTKSVESENSIYYAEAGLNRYLYFLNANRSVDFWETEEGRELENIDIPFEKGFYRITVIPPGSNNPNVTVQSTGWVTGGRSVTVQGELTKSRFTDYVYGTNIEELDVKDNPEIWWGTGDVVNGDLHTNGTLHIQGRPVFNGKVTYSGGLEVRQGSKPVYRYGAPKKVAEVAFPDDNKDIADIAAANGYVFEGRTCIMVDGDKLKIRVGDGPVQEMPLPPNGVIHVKAKDETAIGKFNIDAANVFISGELDGRLTIVADENIYITGYDPTDWRDPSNFTRNDITGGIVYKDDPLSGNSEDMLGLIAAKNVEILHSGWPSETGGWPDIEVTTDRQYDPYWRRWVEVIETRIINDVSIDNINIHAAIFVHQGSFGFEQYDLGQKRETINFVGSMFQNRRGPVGTFNSSSGAQMTGYSKNYNYDPRMKRYSPPHFVMPKDANWYIVNWGVLAEE